MPDYANVGDLAKIYVNGDEIDKVYVNQDLIYSAEPPVQAYLEFSSSSSFTLKTYNTYKGWDGTIERSTNGGSSWSTWTGTTITAGLVDGLYRIYLRGTGNTYCRGGINDYDHKFTLTGSSISCNGNIETLLDYATVAAGNHPAMATFCYRGLFHSCSALISLPDLCATTLTTGCYGGMFRFCSNLTTIPSNYLSSTSLAQSCYSYMFENCINLATVPDLPATTLQNNCYSYMFQFCERIGLWSTSQPNTTIYRIPPTGTATTATDALYCMFQYTSGNIQAYPTVNRDYYINTIPYTLKPKNLSITSGTLTWTCDETNATYVILRSTTASGTYTQVTTTSNKTYIISSSYKEYYFKVRTTRSGYLNNESDPIQYKTTLLPPQLYVDDDATPDVKITNPNITSVTYHYDTNTSYKPFTYSGTLSAGEYSWVSTGISFGDIVYVYFSASGYDDSDMENIEVYQP